MSDLDSLRSRLNTAFGKGPRTPETWCEPQAMTKTLEKVRERHDTAFIKVNERTIAMAVEAFRKTGQIAGGFQDLKYVCLGAGFLDNQDWCLLGEKHLRDKLLALAESSGEPRRQLKCFQSLLRSYWGFSLNDPAIREKAKEGWIALRNWLAKRHKDLVRTSIRHPEWLTSLSKHSNLLTDKPCDRYGQDLLRGEGSELQQAMEGLAIPSDSWVTEEAVFAQMKAAAALRKDREFNEVLATLLSVATGKAGVSVSRHLSVRCVALLVARYARCLETPEHMALRDAAVAVIGNPWLRRASWDALVLDEKGTPDNYAREMVNGWLKRRLISDFFELLSADGAGDRRRLDYWLRFEPFIADMWFALGANARYRRGETFEDFRHRAKGRLLDLDQTTADNNAFVMRIGEYLAVEFGSKGNAFYLFRWDSLPPPIAQKLTSGKEKVHVSIHGLKSSKNEDRLIHRDRPGAGRSWEQKFDEYICPLVGNRPAERPRRLGAPPAPRKLQPELAVPRVPAETGGRYDVPVFIPPKPESKPTDLFSWIEFERFVAVNKLKVVDHRTRDGALWILAQNLPKNVANQLTAWGFRYKYGRGWWKE